MPARPAHAGSGPQRTVQPVAATSPVPVPARAGATGRGGVVQRQLEITDAKAHFVKSADAKLYLEGEYKKILASQTQKGKQPRAMKFEENVRLQEIAGKADEQRYLYPIPTLQQAMEYIASGKRLDIQRFDTRPDLTPERDTKDTDPWGFTLHKSYTPPTKMEVPQSPTHETFFPSDTTFDPSYIDLLSSIKEVRDDIGEWTKQSTKSHLGKNHYSYKLRIQYRLDELEEFKDVKGTVSYVPKQLGKLNTEVKSSPFYTSKKDMAPQEKGGKKVSMETEIRNELTYLHKNFDRGEFKETSLFAEKKGQRTKTAQFYQTAKVGQLASLYFHSEVQASSDESGARKVAQKAVHRLVNKALAQAKLGKYSLVVVAGIITGYSHSRTVCGNACKPALAHLSSIIADEMTQTLHRLRNTLQVKYPELKIRRSSRFRVSAHVGAHVEFQGLETGAKLGKGKPTVLPHNQVFEYQPFQ